MKHTQQATREKNLVSRCSRAARIHAILLCAALSSTALSAHAEGPAPAPASAEELASQAYNAYTDGKFSDAIALYMKSYNSYGTSAALLNVATIYDRNLHEREAAAEYYRRYLRAPDADSDRVKKVTERLSSLKREAEEEAARTGAAPPPTAAPARASSEPAARTTESSAKTSSGTDASSGNGTRTAGLITGAVGLVSLGTSGVLSFIARKQNSDADAYCTGNVCSDQRGVDLAHQAGTTATVATVTFVSGLALLGTGVALYVLAPKKNAPSTATLSVAPVVAPTASGINLLGRF